MIKNRLIDEKITLRDLLAQAVCMGVRAGRGDIDYIGAWPLADEILNETEEVMRHRKSILGLRDLVKVESCPTSEMSLLKISADAERSS